MDTHPQIRLVENVERTVKHANHIRNVILVIKAEDYITVGVLKIVHMDITQILLLVKNAKRIVLNVTRKIHAKNVTRKPFYIEENECKECKKECKACESADKCTKCRKGYYLHDDECIKKYPAIICKNKMKNKI